jgi:hypothetical protein
VSQQPPLPVDPDWPATGMCPSCLTRRRLKADGRLILHKLALPVSARAVRTVGTGSVSRVCPGSGGLPRPPAGHPAADPPSTPPDHPVRPS